MAANPQIVRQRPGLPFLLVPSVTISACIVRERIMLDEASLAALAAFPDRLQQCLEAVPPNLLHWAPRPWDEAPSERLTALEQVCHVRDIERDGYQRRFRRLLDEAGPFLESIDGYALARERGYAGDDASAALA